jgi:tight adherence protein B
MALFWATLTFIAVVMLVSGVSLGLAGRDPTNLVRRLDVITEGKGEHKSVATNLTRDESLSAVPQLNRLLERWTWAQRLQALLAQAGLKTKPGKFFLISAVLAAGAYIIVSKMVGIAVAAVCASFVAALAPFFFLTIKRQRRFQQFRKGFPEAIDLLVRAIRAGHAFTSGLELISTELPEPIASEFRKTFEEHNYGLPLRDALWNLAERVPLIDVRFFVSALLIQKETGGNLAEILENLANVIRERFKIIGEMRVRTAQGRLTALILIALPPSLLAFQVITSPSYVNVLFTDPWGIYMLLAAAVLQVIGSLLLWRIVSIQV